MITIYGRKNCGWCDSARMLCKEKDRPYEYIDIMDMDNEDRAMLVRVTRMQTVPIILVHGELVGGYTDLTEWFKNE
jgi:glutaredoxin